jgi:Heparinase II/III-like protein
LSVDIIVRASIRLTPRMAIYQVKRHARNMTVPKIAVHYNKAIRAAAARLPLPKSPDRIPLDLASFIGAYYFHSDHAMRDAARGRFTILGRTVDFDSIAGIDWSYRLPDESDCHLWRQKLAQLEVLHSLVASSNPRNHETAIALLDSFTKFRNLATFDGFAIGWAPYCTSHRLLAAVSGLSVAVQKGSLADDVRTQVEEFANLDAAFLWRNIEHDLRNNHTERNLAALCLYHFAAGSISSALAKVLDREVNRIICSTVLADGMQVERSAMYQGLTVMSLRIFAACPFLSAATRALAYERAEAATRAWLFLTHSDGEIALFNDSWLGEVPPPATVLDSESIALPRTLPEAGYFRLTAGSVVAIMDAGEIGPRWNPGHGHADFLALEVDSDGRRFIVDPGTSQYSTGPQRAYERSSASHNGPRYSGVEPVEYSGRFKVGKLIRAVPLEETDLSKLSVAAIGGQIKTSVGSCTRVVCALPSGGFLVVDRWGSPKPVGATSILIPSEWHIDIESPTLVRARSTDTETTLAVYHGHVGAVDAATWSRHYMQTEPALLVTLEPAHDPSGLQQLVFGIGVVRPSEIPVVRAQVDTHIKNH